MAQSYGDLTLTDITIHQLKAVRQATLTMHQQGSPGLPQVVCRMPQQVGRNQGGLGEDWERFKGRRGRILMAANYAENLLPFFPAHHTPYFPLYQLNSWCVFKKNHWRQVQKIFVYRSLVFWLPLVFSLVLFVNSAASYWPVEG